MAALDRIAGVAPRQVARARAELDVSLRATRASALGPLAWQASRLTPCGFPVELAFSSANDELRTVVEVVAPEADRKLALPAALDFAGGHGSVGLATGADRLLAAHQAALPFLRFGAWLGSRHPADPPPARSGDAVAIGGRSPAAARTRHKVYVETSPDSGAAWRLVDALAPAARPVLGGLGAVRFVGLALDGSDRVEVYLRPHLIDDQQLTACLGRGGVGDLAPQVVAALGGPSGDHPHRRLLTRNLALSVAVVDGAVSAVAGFGFAHHRYGTDDSVRTAVLADAAATRWPSIEMYAAASAPCARTQSHRCAASAPNATGYRRNGRPHPATRPVHGALSVVATTSGVVEHHVGLAPPRADPPISTPLNPTSEPVQHDTAPTGAPIKETLR